jgi:hypothetical protein
MSGILSFVEATAGERKRIRNPSALSTFLFLQEQTINGHESTSVIIEIVKVE